MSDKIFVPGLSNLPPLDPKRDLSKTFLHVNRKMVCIYDYYLEQAAVFDVGLLKQRKRSTKSKSGLLKKQKRPTKRKPPLPPLPWLGTRGMSPVSFLPTII